MVPVPLPPPQPQQPPQAQPPGLGDPDPLLAITRALRGSQNAAANLTATGDPVLSQVGAMWNQQGQQNAQLGQHALSQAMSMQLTRQQRETSEQRAREQGRHNSEMEKLGWYRAQHPSASGAGPLGIDDPSVVQVGEGVIRGDIPPDLRGMYKQGFPVRAYLSKKGFDLSGAEMDWNATKRFVSTLNGPQQVRMRQAVDMLPGQLDKIEELYGQWQAQGWATRFRGFNRKALEAAKATGGDAGAFATTLESQINDLSAELGNVYMGGNTPTDHALALARTNLAGEWDEPTFRKALEMLRYNVNVRRNSLKHSMPAGGGARYYHEPGEDGGGPPPPPPGGGGATHKWNPQTQKLEPASGG